MADSLLADYAALLADDDTPDVPTDDDAVVRNILTGFLQSSSMEGTLRPTLQSPTTWRGQQHGDIVAAQPLRFPSPSRMVIHPAMKTHTATLSEVSTADATPLLSAEVTPFPSARGTPMYPEPPQFMAMCDKFPSVVLETSGIAEISGLCASYDPVPSGGENNVRDDLCLGEVVDNDGRSLTVPSSHLVVLPAVAATRVGSRGSNVAVSPSLKAGSPNFGFGSQSVPRFPGGGCYVSVAAKRVSVSPPPKTCVWATAVQPAVAIGYPRPPHRYLCSSRNASPTACQDHETRIVRPSNMPTQPWSTSFHPADNDHLRKLRATSREARRAPAVEIDQHFRASCCTAKQVQDRKEIACQSPRRSPEECRLPQAVQIFKEFRSPRELSSAPRATLEEDWRRSICSEKKRGDEEMQKTRVPFRDQVEDCLPRAAIDFREASPEIRSAPLAEIEHNFRMSCCEEKRWEDEELQQTRVPFRGQVEDCLPRAAIDFREASPEIRRAPVAEIEQNFRASCCEEKRWEDVRSPRVFGPVGMDSFQTYQPWLLGAKLQR